MVVLNLLRAETVSHQVHVENLSHAVAIPDNVLQVRVIPSVVARGEHGQVLHVLHARDELGIVVLDGLPEFRQWPVFLLLFDCD